FILNPPMAMSTRRGETGYSGSDPPGCQVASESRAECAMVICPTLRRGRALFEQKMQREEYLCKHLRCAQMLADRSQLVFLEESEKHTEELPSGPGACICIEPLAARLKLCSLKTLTDSEVS
ncbi:MAG: hypothetical protein WCF54_18775, partial [Terracidiphilus sp.]